MGMSSTCVLFYGMPYFQGCITCIFVISVVTSTSMQTRLRNVSDFRDLVISPCLCLLLFCCHVNLMLQRDPCIFWICSVRMFCRIVIIDLFLPLFAIMECHSLTQSCSTFTIKYFWKILNMIFIFSKLVVVDPYMLFYFCWQIFYVLFNFAKLVVVVPYMICTCSCHG